MASTVEQQVFTALRDDYTSETGDSTIVWYYGRRWLSASQGWPRVVAVRERSTYEPLPFGKFPLTGAAEKKNIFQRTSFLTWHCWASNDEDAETIESNIIATGWRLFGNSSVNFTPIDTVIVTEQDGAVSDGGTYLILNTSFVFLVDDELSALPLTAPTDFDHTTTLSGDEVC